MITKIHKTHIFQLKCLTLGQVTLTATCNMQHPSLPPSFFKAIEFSPLFLFLFLFRFSPISCPFLPVTGAQFTRIYQLQLSNKSDVNRREKVLPYTSTVISDTRYTANCSRENVLHLLTGCLFTKFILHFPSSPLTLVLLLFLSARLLCRLLPSRLRTFMTRIIVTLYKFHLTHTMLFILALLNFHVQPSLTLE